MSKSTIASMLFSMLMIVGISGTAVAADEKKAKAKQAPQSKFEMLAKRLNLDENQKKKLEPMLEKLGKDRADTMSKMKARHDKELKTVLDEDQIKKVHRYMKKAGRNKGMGKKEKRNKNKDGKKRMKKEEMKK